jgi:ribonuclease P protein component
MTFLLLTGSSDFRILSLFLFGFVRSLNLIEMLYRNTFPKAEHLCGKTSVDKLFTEGKSFLSYPLRIVFCLSDKTDVPVRCLMAAPKRRFKHAVDRNRLKRQLRESYRLNKGVLLSAVEGKDYQLLVAFNYIGDKVESTAFVERKMRVALEKLAAKLP